MKKFLLLLISFAAGLGIFIWIGKTVGWQEIKNAFLVFTGWQGLVIFGLTLLGMVVGVWKWKVILRGNGIQIPFKNLFGPYLAGFAAMYLVPVVVWGGETFRSYALKEKHSIPWTKGMASVITDRIMEWTANLAVIFFGTSFFFLNIGLPPAKLAVILGSIFLFFLIVLSFFYFKCIKRESIVNFFIKINNDNQPLEIEKEIFIFFKLKKKAMWKAFGLSFFRTAIMYFRTFLLILFLGKSVGALPALSILGFTYFAAMIPIPAALGSHEAIQTFAFGSLGLGSSTATAFTMIIRTAELIIALFGLIIFCRLWIILLKDRLLKRLDKIVGGSKI